MTQHGFSTRRPAKCHCGWTFNTWHICVDLTTPEPVLAPVKKPMPLEQREKLAEAARKRAVERNKKRDAKIIRLYLQGQLGMRDVATEVGCAYQTVRRVLMINDIPIRPAGVTLSRPGDYVHGAFN